MIDEVFWTSGFYGFVKNHNNTGCRPLRKLRDAVRNFSRNPVISDKPLGFIDIGVALGSLLADHGEGIIQRE